MKRLISTSFIIGIMLTLSSFTNNSGLNFIGTYGVSENDPAIIELNLNEDGTFTYKDLSNSTKEIDVNGNWEVKNKFIFLKNYNSKFSFHNKWKILKNGRLAKSRKGMSFYTLIKK